MSNEDKETAEKCIEIAQIHLETGNFDKAERLALKAQRLFPSDVVTKLLEKIRLRKQSDTIKEITSNSMYTCKGNVNNLEDAERCIEVAQQAMFTKNFAKARRMLNKAERLYPSARAKELLKQIGDEGQITSEVKAIAPKPKEVVQPEVRAKRMTSAEQVQAIQQVKNAKNDYQILGVPKQCDMRQVKKAYRHLTLLLHPDKNKEPGAKETFMTDASNNSASNSNGSAATKRSETAVFVMSNEDKETAEKCIEIAQIHLETGNFDKAERLALKAQRLFPSDVVTKLLEKIRLRKQSDTIKEITSNSMYTCKGNVNNLEDAERCIEVAQQAMFTKNFAKARRMLNKAERLYPSARAKELLKQIGDEGQITSEVKAIAPKPKEVVQPEVRAKRMTSAEQVQAIQQVKNAKNDYQILGVPKQCDMRQVKKAYRHLTLLLHPDKNKEPGAKETFMLVINAKEKLTKEISCPS